MTPRSIAAWLLCASFLWSTPATAQSSTAAPRLISGQVVDATTRAPVPGATVSAGERQTTSDPQGRFTLQVPPGRIEIQIVAPGHFPLVTTLDTEAADVTGAELALALDTGFSTSIAVVAAAPTDAPATEVLQPVQVLRTPGALDNVFRTLQTLPGVAATEEFSSRLAVRGGSPDQNLTMMDGVEIHDPFRLFGLTSAFNPETIQRFELATGGFSAKYGDRLSSLLLVENRDGRTGQGLTGSAALSITDANAVFEGGLPGGAKGSWLATGRRTYYDLVAAKVTGQDFPGFADLQAKGVWDAAPGRRLSLFGLRSRQAADFEIDDSTARGQFQDDTENDLGWTRVETSVGTRGQSRSVAAYSSTRSLFGVDASVENSSQRANAPGGGGFDVTNVIFSRALTVRDLSLRQELTWVLGRYVIETGGELHQISTRLGFDITGDRNPAAVNGSSVQGGAGLPDSLQSSTRTTRGGAWLQDTIQLGSRTSVQAGLRLDRAGITQETRLSPRLSTAITLGSATTLKAALGQYTQSPGYEKQVQSDYVIDLTDPAARSLRSERATLASAGLERTLGRGTLVRAEVYDKRFGDVLLGALESDDARAARVGRFDFPGSLASSIPTERIITTVPTNAGRGRAYGFDLFVSRTSAPATAKVTGWASYTWGKAERHAYGLTYPFEYDRRHAFTMVSAYRLTRRWELAATTRLASGFPRTAALGLRVAGSDDTTDRDGDGVTDEILPARDANGLFVYAVDFGGIRNLNRARLPLFARVDVRATWRPGGGTGRWEAYVEVINALNRKNAGAIEARLEYDPTADRPRIIERRDQAIPLLPTLGLRFRF